MKKEFSTKWISSKQPRKQKKYRNNAPIHRKRKFLAAMISKELKKKYHKNSIIVRKGDKVKILRGQFKKKEGKIVGINIKKSRVLIDSIQLVKKEGSKVFYPIHASKVQIIELNMEDKLRKRSLERKNGPSQKIKSA